MKTERRVGLHKIALTALYTVGSAMLSFPWKSGEADMPVRLGIYLAVAFLVAFPGSVLLRGIYHRPLGGRVFRIIPAAGLAVLMLIPAFYAARQAASVYIGYTAEILLPGENRILFSVLFLFSAGLLARIPRRGMDLFALVTFFLSLLSFLWLFFRGLPQFQIASVSIRFPETPDGWTAAARSVAADAFLTFLPLAVSFGCALPDGESRSQNRKSLIRGMGIGGGILALGLAQTVLTFGTAFPETRQYPYAAAISVIPVGQYAFRPEILSYLPNFAACLIRVSLCLVSVRRLIGRFFPHVGRAVVFPAAAILGVLLLFA